MCDVAFVFGLAPGSSPGVALQNAFAAALVRSGGSKSQGVSSNPLFWEHWLSGIRNGSLLSISNKTAYTERQTGTRSAIGLRAEHLGTTGGNKSMKRQFSGLAVSAAIVVLAGLLATPAHATLGTLWVNIGGTNSGTTITGGTLCQDNDPTCDTNPTLGILTTNSVALGIVTVTGSTSKSSSPVGSMSLSLNATPSALGIFHVSVSDILFNSPPPPLVLKQQFGGGSLGGTTANLGAVGYFGSTDVLFDTSAATATATPSANTTLNAGSVKTQTGNITSGNPYSL